MRKYLGFLFCLALLVGCAVNPVTGRRELDLVSEGQELALGQEHYGPSRQMQGGDYVVKPELSTYVNQVGQRLVKVSDRQLPYEFVVLNNSAPNAWSLPGGKIAVNRGLLLELNSEAELAAVLAHEIVHAAARHGAKGMERGLLLQGALIAAGLASHGTNYNDLVVGSGQVAAGMISSKYGRDAEREADYYGMLYMSRAGYDPLAAVKLQETFVELSKKNQQNWLTGLFASHPPSEERVANNRETAKQLPPGGRLGREDFQKQIAHLQKTKDAYKFLDQGLASLAKNDAAAAQTMADKALAIEPLEARFYGLRGDARLRQKNYSDALRNYDQALALNGNFFYFYLQRGLTRIDLREEGPAVADLETSLKLLPTAVANNALGKIAMNRGNQAIAKEYFRAAAESQSDAGKQAMQELVRLDLPDNPGKYLRLRLGRSGNGTLLVETVNQTPVAVSGVTLQISVPDGRGGTRQLTQRLEGVIPAGRSVRTDIGVQLPADAESQRAVQAQVVEAQVVH